MYPPNRSSRRPPVAVGALAVFLGLATAFATVAGAADSEDEDSAFTAGPATDQGADSSRPAGTQRDVLFVTERLPHVPRSNTIAAKVPVELVRTPTNVGVVSSGLFQEQGATFLGDALTNVSGVNVQPGFGVFDFFVLRGFDSLTSGLVLTDGAPEPESTYYQLYNTEQIEVLKGPAGFLYGSNPLAGAVNLVRKQPAPNRFGLIRASVGSFDTYEGSLDYNVGLGDDVAFRINGLWRESDGYRNGKENETVAINPALRWTIGDATFLNLNVEAVQSDFIPDAGLPIVFGELAPVSRKQAYESPFDRSEQDVLRFQADFETALSDRVTLRNKLYYRDLDWLSNGTIFNGVFPTFTGQLEVSRSLILLDDHQKWLGNQLEAVVRTSVGGVSHTLLAGLELGRLADEYSLDVALLPGIDLLQPVERAAEPLFLIPGQSTTGDSETTVIAPYVIDQIAFSDRFQMMIGARFDSIDFDDAVSGTSRSDSELSPMIGFVYAPSAGFSVYANAGRSFAPPSVRVVGERRPEESRQVEVGLRKELFDGNLRSTLALFQLERENIAIPDDNGFTQQAGDQRSRGVELELVARLGPGLEGLLSYAYTDAELTRFTEQVLVAFFPPTSATVDRSGNRPAFAPEHLARLWLSKRFAGGFSFGGGVRYVGQQFIAEDNAFELDEALTLDGTVSYGRDDWRLHLNLYNLADEDYETRGFGSTSVIPANPFSATLAIELRL